ncbi:MAG: SPASM domain-containing protein [Ruminococcus sp.]|nr:SPASM domain-containing protein [Ruminococcus sp.]
MNQNIIFGGVLPLLELNAFLPQEINLTLWKRILEEFRSLGGYLLRFHADNITRCRDIQRLTAVADRLDLSPCTAINGVRSGYSPLDPDILSQTNLYCVSVMTDGKLICQDDYLSNIRSILVTKTKIELYLKVTQKSLSDLEPVAQFCAAYGIPACIVDIERFPDDVSQKLRGREYYETVKLCSEITQRYAGKVRMSVADCPYLCTEGNLNMRGGCTAGIISCAVDENAMLFPCAHMNRLAVGDLNQQSLGDLWNNSEIFVRLRNRSTFSGSCGVCAFREKCGGCRAESYAAHGDYFGSDPMCWLSDELSVPGKE